MNCTQPQAHPTRCGCDSDVPVGYVSGERYEAQQNRLMEYRKERDTLRCERDQLQAELAALRATHPAPASVGGVEAIAEVSEETFSSDGTSDIITCNLPIGTKLYAHPAAAVPAGSRVVPVELLERCAGILESQGFSAWDDIAREIRALPEVKP